MSVDYATLSPDGRGQVIQELLRSCSSLFAELCRALVAADEAGDWRVDEANTLAEWTAQLGALSPATARELVRTAGRLAELPALSAALADGRLSWDQAVPAARLATPDTDDRLADELVGVAPTTIELMARSRRPEPAPRDRSVPSMRIRRAKDGNGVHLSIDLPTAEAVDVTSIVDRLALQDGTDPDTGLRLPIDQRRGLALCELLAGAAAGNGLVRSSVTFHAEASLVDAGEGAGHVGLMVADPDGVNRLLCDAEIEWVLHDHDGTAFGIGRQGRLAPAWLAQRVMDRDLACRFPGCDRPIRQIHHVHWWSKGGPTNSDNLAGLCWTHHWAVHHRGWEVEGNADSELVFIAPTTGRRFRSRVRPEWRPPRTTPPVRHQVTMRLAAGAVPGGADTTDRPAA